MTVERGCTAGEADTAALKIGQAVQRYNLVILPPQQEQKKNSHSPGQRSVSLCDVEAIAETDKALLCIIDCEEVWGPLSQICEESEVTAKGDFGTLVVTTWFAKSAGLWRRGGYGHAA
jgi:hypothetical protein